MKQATPEEKTGRIGAFVDIPSQLNGDVQTFERAYQQVLEECIRHVTRSLADGRRYTVQLFEATERHEIYGGVSIERRGVILLWLWQQAQIGEWCDATNMKDGPFDGWRYQKYMGIDMAQRLK